MHRGRTTELMIVHFQKPNNQVAKPAGKNTHKGNRRPQPAYDMTAIGVEYQRSPGFRIVFNHMPLHNKPPK
jgi:hypothetical protein